MNSITKFFYLFSFLEFEKSSYDNKRMGRTGENVVTNIFIFNLIV